MSEIFGRMGGPRDAVEQASERGLAADPLGVHWLRRRHAGGAAALTTVVDGTYRAATVSAFMVASLDPPQLLVSVERESQMARWLRESAVFGLSLFPWSQQFLADQFAGFTPLASRRFEGIEHFIAQTGAPLLSGCIAWADCRVAHVVETGDHLCFVGDVAALGRGSGDEDDPLIYFLSRYRRLR